jgi:hypothetical protein
MRERVGPAKNLLWKRQRSAQQDTKTLWSLAGVFRFPEQKSLLKLGRFTRSFAEITDVKISESYSAKERNIIPNINISSILKKSSCFLFFQEKRFVNVASRIRSYASKNRFIPFFAQDAQQKRENLTEGQRYTPRIWNHIFFYYSCARP